MPLSYNPKSQTPIPSHLSCRVIPIKHSKHLGLTTFKMGQDKGALRHSTDFGEPLGHSTIDLIQDEDDHKVDDDCCGSHRGSDIGVRGLVERQGSCRGDPIQNDPKDDGKRQGDLFREDRRRG